MPLTTADTPAAPQRATALGVSSTEAHNARVFIAAQGLQNVGDQLVNAKTILPWVLHAGGVPGFLIALLVPIRESGSMLPQVRISAALASRPNRVRLWTLGAAGQAAAALGIALAAWQLEGMALGLTVVVLLGVLALARAVCSITSKDVQGRTISKGRRGRVSGLATAWGGGIAVTVGLGLKVAGSGLPSWALALLIGAGAASWAIAAFVFTRTIDQPDTAGTKRAKPRRAALKLLRDDAPFRHFVIVRSLLLVSALSPTFVVTMSHRHSDALTGLAPFVLASGVASLAGGRVSGWLSDRSSKNTMTFGALAVSVILVALILLEHSPARTFSGVILPAAFFLIALCHTAIRVARKTYVVDMAEGDKRTEYVAVANSAMGVVLLLVGAISGAFASLSPEAALGFLAAIGLVGVFFGSRMQEVSAKA
ncbi:MFS transporter [Corynebacterium aquilae]|uniref:MFS transporter n=1 Tax=Corynebacterium aquilae TaxID=203263 RepID=UPI000951FFA3|nr:MFS transporter [Corynebacterium aquilae]